MVCMPISPPVCMSVFIWFVFPSLTQLRTAGLASSSSVATARPPPERGISCCEQIPTRIAQFVFSLSENRLVILFLMNGLMLFMGTFLDVSPIIIILVPILFPIASQFGVTPIHFGVMTIVNMAIGQCTPPVGISLFVATGIAKASLGEILGAYSKYLVTMIVVLAIITVFPQIITFLPEAVMGLK